MSLFQKSVEKKYLSELDAVLVDSKYKNFQNYFGNPAIQENIRNSKEEQFQEGFLRELFVSVFGYTLNPQPDFNLTTELKNIANSKKADGAILLTGEHANARGHDPLVLAVIELKGTDTTDLDKIETQAFGYKNHHPKCVYVITSNFEKLRFYIQNAVDHLDFDLFNLTREQFSLLWLCLAKDNLLGGLPLKIKETSVLQEENITKKLYADYSKFREAIYNNLVINNPETDKLLLFRKTQKLIDRFLFIFFAEDRLLVPPNSISQIIEKWKDDVDFGDAKPLYHTFKKYFHVLNVGRPKSGNRQEIFAYNGGLFSEDEILDNINIDDAVLYEHTLKLSQYNYETDVDVNILGHIFEHSLGEIENVQAEIKGEKVNSQKTKRKKDGIFYTPKYITKYIVENTVGKLCEEKRAALEIIDEEYAKGRKNRKKDTITALDKKLTDYRNWLLSLTILDPACGSGAFLNQALDFLITEHRKIDDLRAQLFGSGLVFSDITTDILEKNIYGVDINEESVEIAKLSLWLRTAQKGRKLNKLNNNIKCGNSLIDDPEVAGEKAFHWQNEFPNIFQKKNKKAWLVTTATHNSRYSQRMFDSFVKLGEPVWLSEKEEIIVSETIAEIAEKDKLNILAYNICGDHAHILLVCEEEELPKIVQKIKSMSARACNIAMGRTVPQASASGISSAGTGTREQAPLSGEPDAGETQEHAPRATRGETQFHLWTQKFGNTPITSTEQLENTIRYIENNRIKHGLDGNGGACSPERSMSAEQNKGASSLVDIIGKITCTREHAFRTEYKGGFDVVIGNPPYGAKLEIEVQNYLNKFYIKGGSETAISFLKLSHSKLLKKEGNFGFIIPKSFTYSSNYETIRGYLSPDISKIVDCKKVWKEVKLEQVILFFTKQNSLANYCSSKLFGQSIFDVGEINKLNFYKYGFFLNDISAVELSIADKMRNSDFFVKDIANNSRGGMIQNSLSENGKIKVIGGAEIQREGIVGIKGYVDETIFQNDEKTVIKTNSILVQNIVAHIENPIDHIKITACLPTDRNYAIVDTINQIVFKEEYDGKVFWILFNSKLINWFCYRFIFAKAIRTMHFDNAVTNRIPIPFKFEQDVFVIKADLRIKLFSEIRFIVDSFYSHIQLKYQLNSITNKLQNWHVLEFKDFLKELQKAKIKLSLSEEAEWMNYFNEQKQKAQTLKSEIEKTDREIDRMVYALYGLTEDEIKIVEESV